MAAQKRTAAAVCRHHNSGPQCPRCLAEPHAPAVVDRSTECRDASRTGGYPRTAEDGKHRGMKRKVRLSQDAETCREKGRRIGWSLMSLPCRGSRVVARAAMRGRRVNDTSVDHLPLPPTNPLGRSSVEGSPALSSVAVRAPGAPAHMSGGADVAVAGESFLKIDVFAMCPTQREADAFRAV